MANDWVENCSIDGQHQYGVMVKDITKMKVDFHSNAVRVQKETGADHVAYCCIGYKSDGEITYAHFYSGLQLTDAEFEERTRSIPGTDYIGAVHAHR